MTAISTKILRQRFFCRPFFALTLQVSKDIHTSTSIDGKNKYTTPVREIILANMAAKDRIKYKKQLLGIPDPNDGKLEIFFNNKNPRHLDLLGFNKPAGFTTLYENRNFFNKLHLQMTNRHTKAFVENVNGQIICYASTTEIYIANRLHSTTDVSAVVNIARILAERLKQVGVNRVSWITRLDRTTEKIREFEGILRNDGIILSESATKELKGPSQTLPPPRRKRTYPGPLKRAVKNQGTILRKDKH